MTAQLSPDFAGLHTVTINHDPASHEDDCHDECEATLACPGVTDACRCWWECQECEDNRANMGVSFDEWVDLMYDEDERAWHGEDHSHIDGMWMTPSDRCIGTDLEHDAGDLIYELPEGVFPVDLDCDEGFVHVMAIAKGDDGKWHSRREVVRLAEQHNRDGGQ